MTDTKDYLVAAEDWPKLRSVMDRLYGEKPLTGDERRDLANLMHAVLGRADPV